MLHYDSFDLTIRRDQEQYLVRVLDSPTGQAWARVPMRGAAVAHAGAPVELGRALYSHFFADQIGATLLTSIDRAQGTGRALRLRLHLADAPELAMLPWETLHGPAPFGFFALSNQTPLIRFVAVGESILSPVMAHPLRILTVMAAAPDQAAAQRAETEWLQLEAALAPAAAQGLVALERLSPSTVRQLQRRLRLEPPIHVLHFVGDSQSALDGERQALLWHDEAGPIQPLSAEQLGVLVRDHATLRLAFLNMTAASAPDAAMSALRFAEALVKKRFAAAIALRAPLSAPASAAMVEEFYTALAGGHPVDEALTEARKRMHSEFNTPEWAAPVALSRALDGPFFVPEESSVEELNPKDAERDGAGRGDIINIGGTIGTAISVDRIETLNLGSQAK